MVQVFHQNGDFIAIHVMVSVAAAWGGIVIRDTVSGGIGLEDEKHSVKG
jgi:hypothetical protein